MSTDDSYSQDIDVYALLDSDEPLTVEKATQVVDQTRRESDDPEAAHSYEDQLMTTFIRQIADGVLTDPNIIRSIAAEIKKVSAMKFARWCA